MKKIFLAGLLTLMVASPAHAKLVHYTDANGKIHYLNTDFSKVPPEYYNQVRSQLEEPKPKPVVPVKPNNNTLTLPAQPAGQNTAQGKIIFLTKLGCTECDQLELQLRANQILYQRYDVEYDENGKIFYDDFGAGELPICRVGTAVIRGNDIDAVLKSLQK